MLYSKRYKKAKKTPGTNAKRLHSHIYLAGETGFEPATSGVTGQRPKPLGHSPVPHKVRRTIKFGWCRGPDSDWGHCNFQSHALPTELPRQTKRRRYLAGETGFEPATSGVTGQRPKPLGHSPIPYILLLPKSLTMVGGTGLEPVTPCM